MLASMTLSEAGRAKEVEETIEENVVVLDFTLPGHKHSPPATHEQSLNSLVPLNVGGELLSPEVLSGLRHGGSIATVPVPKTAMDEDRGPPPREHDIRRSRKTTDMSAEPITPCVQRPPHRHFWLGVRTTDAAHKRAPLLRRQEIRHQRSSSDRVGMAQSVAQRLGTRSETKPPHRISGVAVTGALDCGLAVLSSPP